MTRTSRLRHFFGCATLLALMSLGGCATGPESGQRAAVFYPPLPNPPRIQHLVNFSDSSDIESGSSFKDYLVGVDKRAVLELVKPYGVAVHDGAIYAADLRGSGYVVFDIKNSAFKQVRGSGAGRMGKPLNMFIEPDGTKYVTDTQRNQVLVFDRFDSFTRAYGVKGQFKPGDVAVFEDKLYVADLQKHQIQVLDKRSGEFLTTIGVNGSKEGEFAFPTNIEITENGYLYVSDTGNFRIQQLTLDGNFVKSYGSLGRNIGQFARPKGVAVDREGRVYVADAAFDAVQIFDRDARLLLFFGGPGSGPENISLPTDVEIHYGDLEYFQPYAAPGFKLEYIILVASQFGPNKISVFGFGKMDGMDYSDVDEPIRTSN